MSNYSLVLSDELLQVFFDFKGGKVANPRIVENLLNYYHAPYLTTVKQLDRIGVKDNTPLFQALASQGFVSQTLDELVSYTRYKFILNDKESDYPYVNIHKDKVEKNFSLRFQIGENRDKAVQLISALCSDAKFILIFDTYFCDRWNDTKQLFQQVLPKKKLTLLHSGHLTNKDSEIKQINKAWTLRLDKRNTFSNSHDRYLLIDDKIEVLLSSGFDNLFSTDKDLTCIVRYKDET